MYSNFLRLFLAFSSFSPTLFVLWFIKIAKDWNSLHFYLTSSSSNFIRDCTIFFQTHFLLILFCGVFFFCWRLIRFAKHNLPMYPIDAKSIKPADFNYLPILVSWILPFFKLFITDIKDIILLIGSLLIFVLAAYIGKGSYYFNLIFRLLGYKNYEVQTKAEVTFLVLSKKNLINVNQVNAVVYLTEHMLINNSRR